MVELTSSEPYRHGAVRSAACRPQVLADCIIAGASSCGASAFVLPTLLFFAVFKYGPMLWAIELSFNSYDMVSAPRFVGLENYRQPGSRPDVSRNAAQHVCLYRRLDRS